MAHDRDVRVRAFGFLGDRLPAPPPVRWSEELRVCDLVASLDERCPGLAEWVRAGTVRIAMDGEIVSLADPIRRGSFIALLPPVSGGFR